VLKVVSEEILHKSDLGGIVFLDDVSSAAISSAAQKVLAGLKEPLGKTVRGFLLEEVINFEPGLGRELFLGLRSSSEFGPVFTMGFGGTYIEALGAAMRENQSTILFKQGLTSPQRLAEKLDEALFFRWITGKVRGVKGLGQADDIRDADGRRFSQIDRSAKNRFKRIRIMSCYLLNSSRDKIFEINNRLPPF
jgi:hypothetical protein